MRGVSPTVAFLVIQAIIRWLDKNPSVRRSLGRYLNLGTGWLVG
jgi:hypothetical protein